MAPLALHDRGATSESARRAKSSRSSTKSALRVDCAQLRHEKIEALTVLLINAFANDSHERRVREIAGEELPGVPVSLSSEVVPEMQEYERTVTTVANSYVRPRVARYVKNLQAEARREDRRGQAAHPAFGRRSRFRDARPRSFRSIC